MQKSLSNFVAFVVVVLGCILFRFVPVSAVGTYVQINPVSGSMPINLSENGPTEQVATIHLDMDSYKVPSDEVIVSCSVDQPSQIIFNNPGPYKFNSKNGFKDQDIKIAAVDDLDQESNPHIVSVVCTFSSLDPNWNGCDSKGCTSPSIKYEINIEDNDLDTDGDGIVDDSDPDDDGDNVSDKVEDGGPNAGDGNDDGVLDSLQNGVTTLVSAVTGEYQTMAINSGCKKNQVIRYDITPESSNTSQDSQREYALGMTIS